MQMYMAVQSTCLLLDFLFVFYLFIYFLSFVLLLACLPFLSMYSTLNDQSRDEITLGFLACDSDLHEMFSTHLMSCGDNLPSVAYLLKVY